MKRIIIAAAIVSTLTGCAGIPIRTVPDSLVAGRVEIYSTPLVFFAQQKADALCGKHAYLQDRSYSAASNAEKTAKGIPASIPFACTLDDATYSTEADKEKMKQIEASYINYYKAVEKQKEVRRRNADPRKLESHTETGPDGEIRSYSFLNGKTCETIARGGSVETHCE